MSKRIQDRTARVVVVESSGAARQLVTSIARSTGFANVEGFPSLLDLINFLETDQCDWIISSLDAESEGCNLLSLMNHCTFQPELQSVRFSALVGEQAKVFLLKAFELGLLGWHAKPFTKDSFAESFSQFLSYIDMYSGREDLVAAEYIRPILRENRAFDDWIKLEQNILNIHPGEVRLLVNLAEPYALKGMHSRACAILNQAKFLDPGISPYIDAKISTLGDKISFNTSELDSNPAINTLGVDNVVIVDSDETIQKALKDILQECGVRSINCFQDGKSAAEFVDHNPDPGLVIHEWRLPKLSGPLFVQRIAMSGATNTPIIVLSSLIQAADMPLLKEMGVSTVVQKPFDRSEFLKALIWTLQEDRIPTDQGVTEIKIRKLLRAKRQDEAKALIAKFIANQSVPQHRKSLIEAELAYFHQDYVTARAAGLSALRNSGDSINALNLLGKTFMQLRDFPSALKCLQKAQNLSPNNIERLCQIAESQSELGESAASAETLSRAMDLDPDSTHIKEAQAKVAIKNGDTKSARCFMEKLNQLEDLVAYLNNKAVALAKCGQFDDSINQYLKTIEALPDSKPKLKSLVCYNLALALARASELEEALKYTNLALRKPSSKIKSKAKSLHNRLSQALRTGADFHLISAKDSPVHPPGSIESVYSENREGDSESELLNSEVISTLTVKPGEIGCFLAYVPSSPPNGSSLIKPFVFKKRAGIERDETMKAISSGKKAS